MIDKTNWTPANLAWVSGLLEGEVYIGYTAGSMRIECEMTDEDVVKKLHEIVGFGTVYPIKARKEHFKPTWRWGSKNQSDLGQFLEFIFPVMGLRRQMQIYNAMNERLQYELATGHNIKRIFSSDGYLLLPLTA
jgi:hypothetical protein